MQHQKLTSVHLNPARRELFRAARDDLLHAVGPRTIAREKAPDDPDRFERDTLLFPAGDGIPDNFPYMLIHQDCIYPLSVGLTTIGRLHDNHIVLSDPYASRRHCVLVLHSTGTAELHDIASKNGTMVNGKPLRGHHHILHSGDRIHISSQLLLYLAQPNKGAVQGITESTLPIS